MYSVEGGSAWDGRTNLDTEAILIRPCSCGNPTVRPDDPDPPALPVPMYHAAAVRVPSDLPMYISSCLDCSSYIVRVLWLRCWHGLLPISYSAHLSIVPLRYRSRLLGSMIIIVMWIGAPWPRRGSKAITFPTARVSKDRCRNRAGLLEVARQRALKRDLICTATHQ